MHISMSILINCQNSAFCTYSRELGLGRIPFLLLEYLTKMVFEYFKDFEYLAAPKLHNIGTIIFSNLKIRCHALILYQTEVPPIQSAIISLSNEDCSNVGSSSKETIRRLNRRHVR